MTELTTHIEQAQEKEALLLTALKEIAEKENESLDMLLNKIQEYLFYEDAYTLKPWIIFLTETAARKGAVASIKHDLEYIPEAFEYPEEFLAQNWVGRAVIDIDRAADDFVNMYGWQYVLVLSMKPNTIAPYTILPSGIVYFVDNL